MLYALLFLVLAAACDSAMDLIENENYYKSVFSHWDAKFWYKRESWKFAKRIRNYPIDGWHLTKSFKLFFFFMFAYSCAHSEVVKHNLVPFLCVVGAVWILVFNVCYNKLFRL